MNNKMLFVLIAALPLVAGCFGKKEEAPATEVVAPVAPAHDEAEHGEAEHNEDADQEEK